MKAAAILLSTIGAASAFAPTSNVASQSTLNSAKSDLESLASDLNPVVKFYDPLGLADASLWGTSSEATIGFLRHAEIKHGRVAMAAFVGYCVQSNVHFPWKMTLAGDSFPSTDLSPEQQWDALPDLSKWQIIGTIGFLEIWSELSSDENTHYMAGGKPGAYPSFDKFSKTIHPVPLNLYDPLGFSKNRSEADKANGLVTEINNGRLAMIGIFGFLAADKVEGAVPLLKGIAIPYSGEPMAPF